MSGLAQHKDLGELTEESYIGMVGDYFSALSRIKEIDKHLHASAEARKKLPPLKAFESFAEYLTVKHMYDSFDELASPVISRLQKEREEKKKQRDSLEEQLVELLPFGVWFRYGDQAIRVEWMDKRDGEMLGIDKDWIRDYIGEDSERNCVYTLDVRPWSKVAPIPKAATRRSTPSDATENIVDYVVPMPLVIRISAGLATLVAVVEITGCLLGFAS